MITVADVKRCPRCEKYIPRSMFWRDTTRPDGLHSYCKPCHKVYESTRRRKHHDWSRADWSKSDSEIAEAVGCTRQAVWLRRGRMAEAAR